ncbi:unnamed protein product, partial [Polarella glacialis]
MEIEAEVPRGLMPGDTFNVQTPLGIRPVQVPPGALPGQKVNFTVPMPHNGQISTGTPVLLGRVVGMGYPVADAPQYNPGRPYRVKPCDAQLGNVPLLQGIPEEKAERKIYEIHKGGELANQFPPFPTRRKYQDAFWILPFMLVALAVTCAAVYFCKDLTAKYRVQDGELPTVGAIVGAGAAGGAASIVAAMMYTVLAKSAPGCVVWTSLLFSPALLCVGGVALFFAGSTILGLICLGLGALLLTCVLLCYRPFIPFMIKIVETVATVMKAHPSMVLVSCIGSLAGLAWSIVCGLAFVGAYLKYEKQLNQSSGGVHYFVYFCAVLIYVWGGQVTYNFCHVTYCGVFGRWYHKVELSTPVRSSFKVALTTSFGSICFGSFLIAAARASVRQ